MESSRQRLSGGKGGGCRPAVPSECRWQCELCEEMALAQADVKDPHQPSHHLLEREGWVHRQGVFKSIMAVRSCLPFLCFRPSPALMFSRALPLCHSFLTFHTFLPSTLVCKDATNGKAKRPAFELGGLAGSRGPWWLCLEVLAC